MGGVICRKVVYGNRLLRAGNLLCKRPAVIVVNADYGFIAELKEVLLRLEIVFHGVVVIKVILSEVSKQRRFKPAALHPVLIQCLGGNLHHHVLAAGAKHS